MQTITEVSGILTLQKSDSFCGEPTGGNRGCAEHVRIEREKTDEGGLRLPLASKTGL
jgi:hypothetical protein